MSSIRDPRTERAEGGLMVLEDITEQMLLRQQLARAQASASSSLARQ